MINSFLQQKHSPDIIFRATAIPLQQPPHHTIIPAPFTRTILPAELNNPATTPRYPRGEPWGKEASCLGLPLQKEL